MTCGKFHVQSRCILWVLSTVYLVRAVFPMFGGAKQSPQAAFTLVIQRPRIAGGTLTIPIDSTVRLVKCSGREAAHNTIRLRYGPSRKTLVMRASDSLEHEKWLVGLIAAIGESHGPTEHEPRSSIVRTLSPTSTDSTGCSTDERSHHLVTSWSEPQTPPSTMESGNQTTLEVSQSFVYEARKTLSDHHDTIYLPLPASVDGDDIPRIDMHTPPLLRVPYQLDLNSSSVVAPTYKHHSLWRRTRQQLSVATQVFVGFGQGIIS